MRLYDRYIRRSKIYRILEGLDYYLNYIIARNSYNLTPLNINKQKRLKKERKKLKLQVRKELSRLQYLQEQLNSAEEKQSKIIKIKRKNVEELEKEDALLILPLDPIIDILLERAVISSSNTNQQSSFVPSRTSLEAPNNSLSTYVVPKYFLNNYSPST